MSKASSLYSCLSKTNFSAAELLTQLNNEICETISRGMFVTMLIGIYDSNKKELLLSSAGHEPPIIFSKDGNFQFELLKHTTQFETRNRLNLIKKINEKDFLNLDQLKVLSKYWLTLQKKENLKINNGFGFIKSHSSYVAISNNWFTNSDNTAGYIYVVRDPRDIAISWAKHANLSYD